MEKMGKEKYIAKKAKWKYLGGVGLLLGVVICMFAGILLGKKAQAANADISLGTQGDGDIDVKLGDTLNFSLNTVEESSVYYSFREEIATVIYYLEDEYDEVLSQESDTVFRVTGAGSTYLTVLVKNQNGEEISERSYRIVSSVDMSNVALEKNSIKDYRYGQEYSYKTFYVKVNGLEGVQGEDIDFSYTSSNKKMYVYCKFDDGQ